MLDPSTLRSAFPVLADRAYLNAGTCGPLPAAAVEAAAAVMADGEHRGRTKPYFETMLDLRERQRAAYAARLGAAGGGRRADDVDERGARAGARGARPRPARTRS